ncbi:26S protease regulatory subunit [Streptomyces sp. NBRC 110028]|uniref:ATP-binding protein n=1 Tax=Streptomyces sp. NBRC 110028 TaxID=1621260 RepID=UPI000AAB7E55|nr:ATP-binding protein [Streptomyces sp. NBRC 110028]
MPDESPLIQSLRAAVAAAPDDVPLRLHLAGLLLEGGLGQDAISQTAAALQRDPGNAEAQALMARAVTAPPAPAPVDPRVPAPAAPPAPPRGAPGPASGRDSSGRGSYDWRRAEGELADVVPPRFVETPDTPDAPEPHRPLAADGSDDPGGTSAWEVERTGVRLADIGGMDEVKQRLDAAFLAPMRNPELRKLYGKSLRGGLLLYGPPGCGKTYIARAVAGELGAHFMSVSISDVLDMWIGNSERNMRELFQTARRSAPCVLFLDELDALGAKRSQLRHSGLRTTVNQLLAELDGVDADANEGWFVLAATNHPWDVDGALRRPGRLDRTLRGGVVHGVRGADRDRPVDGPGGPPGAHARGLGAALDHHLVRAGRPAGGPVASRPKPLMIRKCR